MPNEPKNPEPKRDDKPAENRSERAAAQEAADGSGTPGTKPKG
jgi:hypothetical protein